MLKIPSKLSTTLSLVISVLFFIACAGGMIFLPPLVNLIIDTRNLLSLDIIGSGRIVVLILAYMVLAVAMIADTLLFVLLMRVRDGKVFTVKSVSLIRGVSWCCFLIGLIFFVLGFYFYLSFMVAFIAIFLGLCLRIVKNVIEEATEIKSENDLTV